MVGLVSDSAQGERERKRQRQKHRQRKTKQDIVIEGPSRTGMDWNCQKT